MPRTCSCSSTGTTTKIVNGDGTIVVGSGTPADPYRIDAEITSFATAFYAQDSTTVSLNLVGSGVPSDPFILSATSDIAMTQLSDWDDPAGLAVGDVPVWLGDHWEGAPPPTVPPGAVNASTGITGDGTVATPLKVAVSDTTSTSTSGLATYIDSAGKLRAVAPSSGDVAWSSITGKPSSFPSTWDDVSGKPTTFPTTWNNIANRPTISTAAPSGGNDGEVWYRYT